mmetsp:Transcript_13170/g.32295  ORF Transcript_13170/g.32295 Transcript_13170/m.32295 type:complete len:231 (-) Transcript_13170:50-742(-)
MRGISRIISVSVGFVASFLFPRMYLRPVHPIHPVVYRNPRAGIANSPSCPRNSGPTIRCGSPSGPQRREVLPYVSNRLFVLSIRLESSRYPGVPSGVFLSCFSRDLSSLVSRFLKAGDSEHLVRPATSAFAGRVFIPRALTPARASPAAVCLARSPMLRLSRVAQAAVRDGSVTDRMPLVAVKPAPRRGWLLRTETKATTPRTAVHAKRKRDEAIFLSKGRIDRRMMEVG